MDPTAAQPVLIYAGADGPLTLALDRDTISIGRLPDQDLVLRESYVSRNHAAIHRSNGVFELVDRQSTHGTFLNGAKVSRAVLRAGDTIQFGSPHALKVRFHSGFGSTAYSLAGELVSAVSQFSRSEEQNRTVAREMEQLNFLLTAARKLNSGGATADILQALLQLSIQLTSVERGFVFLAAGADMRFALGLRSDGTAIIEDSTVSRSAIERAVKSAARFYIDDTRNHSEAAAWESVRLNAIRCIYCIPLRKHISATVPPRLLGLLYLDGQIAPGRINSVDHQLLDVMATEAATLLENALLAEAEVKARKAAEELAIAASIHAGLMSISLPTLQYARLTARTIPCREIGGDFYDAIALDGCLGAVVADVSGKGVPASIVAATLQGIVHAQMLTGQSLAAIADLVNRFLCDRNVGRYATMVLLKLYPNGAIEYVNCGQLPPVVVSGSAVRRLGEASVVVGLLPDAIYSSATGHLAPGARILLATDGVTDAENSREEQFGEDRFEAAAGAGPIETIVKRMEEFQAGQPALDDCTFLEIQYQG